MSRRRERRLLITEARDGLDELQAKLISEELGQEFKRKEEAKLGLARELNVPLKAGNNASLQAGDAGKVGGAMGGRLVKELVEISLRSLEKNNQ